MRRLRRRIRGRKRNVARLLVTLEDLAGEARPRPQRVYRSVVGGVR